MSVTTRTLPSINIPLTDRQGRMSPIWHEFLRSFVAASVDGTIDTGSPASDVIAGPGLIETGNTLAVGAGPGVAVNDNDVSVDIVSQTNVQTSLEDEVMIADRSDNYTLRKTTIRSIAELAGASPGGNTTYVQYNDAGVFAGNVNFTYNGLGTAYLGTSLNIGSSINIVSDTLDTIHFDGASGINTARIQSDGGGGYTLYSGNSGSDLVSAYFRNSVPYLSIGVGSGNSIQISSLVGGDYGINIIGAIPLRRCMDEAVTANTVQSQGESALTRDYNNVTTVANNNDVVTLPGAMRGRYCTVINNGANILQVYPASGDDLGLGTNASVKMNPGETLTWVASNTTSWHQLVFRNTLQSGITASTTQTQGQMPLTKDVNEISTVANANDTVTLPSAPAYSRTVTIINNGANTLQIFPASGDNLGAGVDTATTLASGANVRYTNYNATNWETI